MDDWADAGFARIFDSDSMHAERPAEVERGGICHDGDGEGSERAKGRGGEWR